MRYFHLITIAIVGILLNACNKQTIQPPSTDLGWEFQPLEKGHYIIYEVDSIIFDDFTKTVDTFQLELKDEIGDSFVDDQGRVSNIVNRSVRYQSTDPWQINHVFYITKDSFKLEWNENNLRFIKMVFPAKLNKKWFGNIYLATQTNSELRWLDDWEYRYFDVLIPYNNGLKTYNDSHIITQADIVEGDPGNEDAFSARTYSQEVFSKNVGMIYREVTRWEYQPTTTKFRKGFTTIFRAKANN